MVTPVIALAILERVNFVDCNDQASHPLRLPADQRVEILKEAKVDFEADGAASVFSTWWVEEEDPLDIGNVTVADGMHARAGRLALNAPHDR